MKKIKQPGMDILQLLDRINYKGERSNTLRTLRDLYVSFASSIPFENFDIHLGKKIHLDKHSIFKKLITHKRGGYCYELNGLFYWILQAFGFKATLLMAKLTNKGGEINNESMHAIVLVELEKRWIADLGWGNGFSNPFCIDDGSEQKLGNKTYKCCSKVDGFELWRQGDSRQWKQLYTFSLEEKSMKDFLGRNQYHQNSKNSPFYKKRICTRLTDDGFVMLIDNKFTKEMRSEKMIREIFSHDEYRSLLKNEFGLDLEINLPQLLSQGSYMLRDPKNHEEWSAFHKIRFEQIHKKYCSHLQYDFEGNEEKQKDNFPFIFTNDNGEVLGTIRIDLLSARTASLRWVAISSVHCNRGLGRYMLSLAEQFIRDNGTHTIFVAATDESKGFYQTCGYKSMPWSEMPAEAGTVPLGKLLK